MTKLKHSKWYSTDRLECFFSMFFHLHGSKPILCRVEKTKKYGKIVDPETAPITIQYEDATATEFAATVFVRRRNTGFQ